MKPAGLAFLLFPLFASAGPVEVPLTIRNHAFEPKQLRVPANQRVKVVIQNLDASPEEFESHELNREKVIPGGTTTNVFIGPLAPGSYPFFGDFHQETAQGVVIAE